MHKPTHKRVHQRSKYVTQIQQQRPESPTVTRTWHACKYKIHKLHQRYILCYRRWLRYLLYLCYVFRALITSLVCWFCTSALGLVLFQICDNAKRKITALIVFKRRLTIWTMVLWTNLLPCLLVFSRIRCIILSKSRHTTDNHRGNNNFFFKQTNKKHMKGIQESHMKWIQFTTTQQSKYKKAKNTKK